MLQADQVQSFVMFVFFNLISLIVAGNFQFLCIFLNLSFHFFMLNVFEGSIGWKDGFIIHKRWGSTQQPLRYAVHVVSLFTKLDHDLLGFVILLAAFVWWIFEKVWTGIWGKLSAPRRAWTGLKEISGSGKALCRYHRGPIWFSFLLLKENDTTHVCGNAETSRSAPFTCLFSQSSKWCYQVLILTSLKLSEVWIFRNLGFLICSAIIDLDLAVLLSSLEIYEVFLWKTFANLVTGTILLSIHILS